MKYQKATPKMKNKYNNDHGEKKKGVTPGLYKMNMESYREGQAAYERKRSSFISAGCRRPMTRWERDVFMGVDAVGPYAIKGQHEAQGNGWGKGVRGHVSKDDY